MLAEIPCLCWHPCSFSLMMEGHLVRFDSNSLLAFSILVEGDFYFEGKHQPNPRKET